MHDHDEVSPDQSIGTVDFQVDCASEVQSDFDRALGLMHHMMYVQARSNFEDIIEADPDCAMAHWGVATTLFQPLWGTRPDSADLQRGWRSIETAREKVESKRESSLIEATAGFFEDPESTAFWPRIDRWASRMEKAHQAHPDDLDITALYGLSLLTLAQRADDRDPLHDRAETLLREVFEQVPTHPGAIHYSIHATDADGRAENALDMVEMYGQIAPEVPHA
ncbi:MAG: tetratricopeptide repeat protein, partial [Wenzhouxiangella sp.]